MKKLALTIVAVVATLIAMPSCGNANKNGALGDSATAQAGTEEIDTLHPWNMFRSQKHEFKVGDHAFGCANVATAANEGAFKVNYNFIGLVLTKTGPEECTGTRLNNNSSDQYTVPNTMLIPIPANATAKAGDVVLMASQAARMKLGYVINDDGTKALPITNNYYYIKDGKINVEGKECDIAPGTFIKVNDGEWMVGAPVICGPGKEPAIILNMSGERLLVLKLRLGHNKVECVNKADCQLMPLHPNFKVGDEVQISRVGGGFTGNYVVKQVEAELGHVIVLPQNAKPTDTPYALSIVHVLKK